MQPSNREPILSSNLSLTDRSLWFGTLELYPDFLSISGWQWTGPFERHIPIDDIKKIVKGGGHEGPNLFIQTEDEILKCHVEGVGFWHQEFKSNDHIEFKVRG